MPLSACRKPLLFLLVLAAAVALEIRPGRSAHADGVTFEVACWNMRWFPSGYRTPQTPEFEARRIFLTGRHMRRQGVPDILFAQEIRNMAVCEQLAKHLQDTAFKPVICSAFTLSGTHEPASLQLAIFSRYPAIEAGFEPWHATDVVFPPRGYAYAVLDIAGDLVACFNVHLKSNFIPEGLDVAQQTVLNRLKRELSSRQLLDKVAALQRTGSQGRPVTRFIIAGDFNMAVNETRFADEKTLRTLLDAGFIHAHDGLEGEEHATLPASPYYPATTFDYILFRGLRQTGTPVVLPAVWISDHREIRTTLTTGGAR